MKHVERVFLKNKLLTLPDFSHQQWIVSTYFMVGEKTLLTFT